MCKSRLGSQLARQPEWLQVDKPMHHVYCGQPRLLMYQCFTGVKHACNVSFVCQIFCTVITLQLHIVAVFVEVNFGLAGVTWLLSSQVVQMTESIWMEQLKAYSRHIASLGQQIAAEHMRVTNWLLHQRGLYALGKFCCFEGAHFFVHNLLRNCIASCVCPLQASANTWYFC